MSTFRKSKDFFLLYDEYYPKIYAHALSRLRHREGAKDVVQQTFEKTLAKLSTFSPRAGATFGSWLFAIAKNELMNVVRDRRYTHYTPRGFGAYFGARNVS